MFLYRPTLCVGLLALFGYRRYFVKYISSLGVFMFSFIKSRMVFACVCVFTFAAFAQHNIIKPDGFISRLRAGGKMYMVPNLQVGREALRAGVRSCIGKAPLTSKVKFQYKAYEIGQKHLSPAILERLVERQLVKVPFPAYNIDFQKVWEQAKEKDHVTLRQMEVVLEAAYGEQTEFEGAFVSSFQEILNGLQRENQGWAAQGALKQAFTQGLQKRSGFFVITVHATQEHGHDVLLLDLKNIQFISVNGSIGEAWLNQQFPIGE